MCLDNRSIKKMLASRAGYLKLNIQHFTFCTPSHKNTSGFTISAQLEKEIRREHQPKRKISYCTRRSQF